MVTDETEPEEHDTAAVASGGSRNRLDPTFEMAESTAGSIFLQHQPEMTWSFVECATSLAFGLHLVVAASGIDRQR